MQRLFLHHDGTRAQLLPIRPLVRAARARGLALTIGLCRDDEDLFADLCDADCQLVVGPLRNTPHGAPVGLAALCPPGHLPIELAWGPPFDPAGYCWPRAVRTFHRALRRHGIAVHVADPDGPVPMFDLGAGLPSPMLQRPGIYLDLERSTDPNAHFVFDVPRLAAVLPDHDLWCTRPPGVELPGVVDASGLSWPERAALANACDVLVGTTVDPFALVLTESNRGKPTALCGPDPRVTTPFWDHPGNTLELLPTMDELVDFLLANVAEVPR